MNRLAQEVSPYLVQHAENPVHWWPWSEAAFAHASQTGKPVLLSIGYSACHWCHVMAHESFEDPGTAAVMNELFVSIKVDREERPDVDYVYMSALHALGEQGGWPLTMFLDDQGKPFWGGTYFPNTPRFGKPGFRDVLRSVARTYAERQADVHQNTSAILAALSRADTLKPATAPAITAKALDDIARRIASAFDAENGGFTGAPKFPNPPMLELLWRAADRTGDESFRAPVLTTLERMCRGGIFDHVAGGFARYSVDERWLVPHFEKMLYDNAQLLPLLALAARHTGSTLFHRAATRTVDWLLTEMRTPAGFAASLDADSLNPDGHAEEGAYYTWNIDEITTSLGARAAPFMAAFDISPGGNFEGRSIPNRLHHHGLAETSSFDSDLAALRDARSSRSSPGCDDKVLADWNGLMIAGLARASEALEQPLWRNAAIAAYEADTAHLTTPDGALAHACRNGHRVTPGFSADHAGMGLAAIALLEATGHGHYLAQAIVWAQHLLDHYRIDSGVLAMTVINPAGLPLRPAPTQDDATPNANGQSAELFVRLFAATGEPQWLMAADKLLAALAPAVQRNPYNHASVLNAFDFRMRRVDLHIPDQPGFAAAAQTVPYLNRTLQITPAGPATVCVDGRCTPPIATPEEFRTRIESDFAPQVGAP